MSAHDYYMLIVGEIGISHETFFKLSWWQARCIIRGYNRRHRQPWSVARWHAFNIMNAMPYTDLKKAGIMSPIDLLRFPWEKPETDDQPISDEEIEDIRKEIEEFNKQQEND